MRKVIVFNQVSLDGYFTDAKGDMSWAHKQDPEWLEFLNGNAKGGGEALYGRKTYELMASWWPTPMHPLPGSIQRNSAYTRKEFETFISQTGFKEHTIKDSSMGFSIYLMK